MYVCMSHQVLCFSPQYGTSPGHAEILLKVLGRRFWGWRFRGSILSLFSVWGGRSFYCGLGFPATSIIFLLILIVILAIIAIITGTVIFCFFEALGRSEGFCWRLG